MTRKIRVIVVGNEKGGSGKSTTAMHLAVGLMLAGRRVGCLDLDLRQRSLGRFMENRATFAAARGIQLAMPESRPVAEGEDADRTVSEALASLLATNDLAIVDTPGSDSPLSRAGHSFADLLVTPLNDSLVDLDGLARVDPEKMAVKGPSHYAELVWQQKLRRAQRDGGSLDWVVLRNRLSHLDAHNKREVGRLLGDLARRIGFRIVEGFGERVIYRELFLKGLTVMDIHQTEGMNLSHVAARQEVRGLIEALRLGP
ncbi:MAG: division plane positioning ATPase MipZ [Magnetospirillum sp. WYHS-4]